MLDKSTVQIDEVKMFRRENEQGMIINWSANIGWGELTFYQNDDGEWKADTECLCSDEDKEFIKAILDKFIDEVKVEG